MPKSNFPVFLNAMQNQRLLHLGHKDADCDTLGSAYAMSRVLPGDVGFALGMKTSAQDLADWLELQPIINPDPTQYDYVILYDTTSPELLGMPLPSRFALFDHHTRGSFRYANFDNWILQDAEWAWLRPLEATCAVVVDLFLEHAIPIDRKMAVALAAGIITDTDWLRIADSPTLRRLADLLDAGQISLEDALQAIANPKREAKRRTAIVDALRTLREISLDGLSVLVAETDSHDHAFLVSSALQRLGSDIWMVSFPKNGGGMLIAECSGSVMQDARLDLGALSAYLAHQLNASDSWGRPDIGRMIAPLPHHQLAEQFLQALGQQLNGTNTDQSDKNENDRRPQSA